MHQGATSDDRWEVAQTARLPSVAVFHRPEMRLRLLTCRYFTLNQISPDHYALHSVTVAKLRPRRVFTLAP